MRVVGADLTSFGGSDCTVEIYKKRLICHKNPLFIGTSSIVTESIFLRKEACMRLVRYTLCDIDLVMVDIEGVLYCSTPQLERVFGVERASLTRLVQRYPNEFSKATCEMLMLTNDQHKKVLDSLELQRLQKKTRLWSEDDIIGITWLVRSDIARKCRAQFKEILKQHARRDFIPADRVEELITSVRAEVQASMQEQIRPLQEAIEELMADKKKMASYAGRSLRLVRGDK
jgi:hypothetical protein